MSAPSRSTRLLIALGGMLAFAGFPLGVAISGTLAKQAAAAAGRSAAWTASPDALYEEGYFLWLLGGSVVSVVGAAILAAGLYRLWKAGGLLRSNAQR